MTNIYPAYAPDWYVPYGYKPSTYADVVMGKQYYLVVGSKNGVKETFGAFLFILSTPYIKAEHWPIGVPIVHGTMEAYNGRLYIFGLSGAGWFWQDGPPIGLTTAQRIMNRIRPPAPFHSRVISKEMHDFLPVRDPDIFDREWKRATA